MSYIKPSDKDEIDLLTGFLVPPRVNANQQEKILLLCDSEDAVSKMSPYNFVVNFLQDVQYSSKAEISRVLTLKIPNVNPQNNTITIVHATAGTLTFTIPGGYYNPPGLANALTLAFNTALGAFDSVAISINQTNRTMTITSVGGYNWYFSATCSFIVRGIYLTGFFGGVATNNTSQTSSIMTMVYSRFLLIRSNRLTQNALISQSRTSDSISAVIAVIPLTNALSNSDFNIDDDYTGSIFLDTSVSQTSCVQNVSTNTGLQQIDFQITTEWGGGLEDPINCFSSTVTANNIIWVNLYL